MLMLAGTDFTDGFAARRIRIKQKWLDFHFIPKKLVELVKVVSDQDGGIGKE